MNYYSKALLRQKIRSQLRKLKAELISRPLIYKMDLNLGAFLMMELSWLMLMILTRLKCFIR